MLRPEDVAHQCSHAALAQSTGEGAGSGGAEQHAGRASTEGLHGYC